MKGFTLNIIENKINRRHIIICKVIGKIHRRKDYFHLFLRRKIKIKKVEEDKKPKW